jgi:hypothetical protein
MAARCIAAVFWVVCRSLSIHLLRELNGQLAELLSQLLQDR